MKIYKDLDTN